MLDGKIQQLSTELQWLRVFEVGVPAGASLKSMKDAPGAAAD
jgi:hypothetical protein